MVYSSEELIDLLLQVNFLIKCLQEINKLGVIKSTIDFSESLNVDHQSVVGALKSLETDLIVQSEIQYREFWQLTDEALYYIEHGSPGNKNN